MTLHERGPGKFPPPHVPPETCGFGLSPFYTLTVTDFGSVAGAVAADTAEVTAVRDGRPPAGVDRPVSFSSHPEGK
jgi:hypothetical protein